MTYGKESYETFTTCRGTLKGSIIWNSTLFGSIDRHKVIIEAAEKVFNEKFPDFKKFETMLSEL